MEVAEAELRAVTEETETSDARHGFALVELGLSLALHGRGEEAIALLDPALEAYRGSERLAFHARHALAMAALATGDARRAVREAELAANARVNAMCAPAPSLSEHKGGWRSVTCRRRSNTPATRSTWSSPSRDGSLARGTAS